MSFAALGASEQQQEVKRLTSADALDVFAALADQDRLTNCLAAAGCLAAARQVCRRLRDLVDGGVKSIKVSIAHDKVETLMEEQTLAALLRRWDRCEDLTVELHGDWGDNAALIQAMPQWLFGGVTEAELSRIQTFTLSTVNLQHMYPDMVPVISTLAARMPSLRHLDLSKCNRADRRRCEGFCTDLAATCPQLETLALPWDAPLPGVEALAGSLVRLRVGAAYIISLPTAALRSISRLEHLRVLSFQGRVFRYNTAGPELLLLLDSLPPSVELLEIVADQFYYFRTNMRICFRGGRLQSVDVENGSISCGISCCILQALAHTLLRSRAAGEGKGTGPQQQRPSLHIREVMIRTYDQPLDVAELGPLRERFSLAPLDAITFESLHGSKTENMAACAGSIASVFGLPKELRDWDDNGFEDLQPVRMDASASAEARADTTAAAAGACEADHGSAMGLGPDGVPLVSAAAAAPSPRGGGSSQTGGSAAPMALETAGARDLMRVVAERLWADTDTSGAAGGLDQDAASTAVDGRELGRAVVLHGPYRKENEWCKIDQALLAELQSRRRHRTTPSPSLARTAVKAVIPPARLLPVGPQLALAMCRSSVTATWLMSIASSPNGPCVREGIQATRLQAGAVKSAMMQVLLELWRGSTTSGPIMSQERRLEWLVELMIDISDWYREDR